MSEPRSAQRRSPSWALAMGLTVAACGFTAATPGAPDASSPGDIAPDVAPDAASAVFTPAPFDDTYDAHNVLKNQCSNTMHIVGSEPVEPGRYPVAIFLVGTNAHFDAPPLVDHILPILASHGFVVGSLEYENSTLFGAAQSCGLYRDNSACMVRNDKDYVAGERRSAIARLCGRANADCSKGVVFLGHSQGGLTSLQAFRSTPVMPPGTAPMPRLVAVAPMGVGPTAHVAGVSIIDLRDCTTAATLAVDPHEVLAINGEHDLPFNGPDADQAGGQSALETVTGRTCEAPTWDCRGPDGDGYVLVKDSQVSTGHAGHGYMDVPGEAFGEPNWRSPENTDAWGIHSVAAWLKARTEK